MEGSDEDLQNGDGVPAWMKNAAKLLNSGADSNDWTKLASKLGAIMS